MNAIFEKYIRLNPTVGVGKNLIRVNELTTIATLADVFSYLDCGANFSILNFSFEPLKFDTSHPLFRFPAVYG